MKGLNGCGAMFHVIIPFKEVFCDLEEQNILDVDNDVDLYCLHVVFTGRINSSLNDFIGSWNSHHLTSENNQIPSQEIAMNHLIVIADHHSLQLECQGHPHL